MGYTRLMADDPVATVHTITACRELISACVLDKRGRVVDAPGDNLLAEFPSATDALDAAAAIQDELLAYNADLETGRRMPFRIGLHLGEVMVDGERIYGDGVNIAARLEAIADPGGVALSAALHEQVRGHRRAQDQPDLMFDELGPREFKNVPRPVDVYRLRLGSQAPLVSGGASEPPAIAVLAFDNLSTDAEQEFLADAIAADLISLLSAWRSFPVIARNSSFTFKGRNVDLKRVSRELHARYVVSGSVRAAGSRVRVTAELADATVGRTIWAEKYDRPLDEILDLQDEVTEAIVSAIQPALRLAEAERARRQAPESLEAWALVNRAWTEPQRDLSNRETADATARAASRALEMQPDYALGHALRAFALSLGAGPVEGGARTARRDDVMAGIRRATSLSPDDPRLWQMQGALLGNLGLTPDAIRAYTRSLELDPNNAQARAGLGIALIFARRSEEGLAHLDRAIRLSPRDPLLYNWLAYRGLLHLCMDRYDDAIADARSAMARQPTATASMTLATALAQLGELEEARAAHQEYQRLSSPSALAGLEPAVRQIAVDDSQAERFLTALRNAGFEI